MNATEPRGDEATQPPANPGVRFPPPLLFVAGLTAGWLLHRTHPLVLSSLPLALRAPLGWIGAGLGLGLMLWGFGTFLRERTAVIPHHAARVLVEKGPYRFTRNPMYLGLTILYLGGVLLLRSWWPLLLLPLVLVTLTRAVIQREERYLAAAFGDGYRAYCRRVPRWL